MQTQIGELKLIQAVLDTGHVEHKSMFKLYILFISLQAAF